MNKAIRKLGLMPDDTFTLLDSFRTIITFMGNSLALVRNLNTAQGVYSAQIVKFVPDPDELPEFGNLVNSAGFQVNKLSDLKKY